MSTLVEALSVVIPRHVLDAGYPGGTEGYLDTARRARGARYAICDERLACVSFSSATDADTFTAPLSALRLGTEDGTPPVACLDEDFGPTAACPWLRWRRHDDGFTSCWLEWTEPGELATPSGWLPPRQRAAGRPFAPPRPLPPTPAPAPVDMASARATVVDTGAAHPLHVVPTAVGPLTPISSPAIHAAMTGNGASNGHAIHDANVSAPDGFLAVAERPTGDGDDAAALVGAAEETIDDRWMLSEFEPTADGAEDAEGSTLDEASSLLGYRTETGDPSDVAETNGMAEMDALVAVLPSDVDREPSEFTVERSTHEIESAADAGGATALADEETRSGEAVEQVIGAAVVAIGAPPDDPTESIAAGWTDVFEVAHAAVSALADAAEVGPSHLADDVLTDDVLTDDVLTDDVLTDDVLADDDVEALFDAGERYPAAGPDPEQQPVVAEIPVLAPALASLTPATMTAATSAATSAPSLDAVRAHLAERGWRYSQDADQAALFYQTVGGRASYPGFAAADDSAQLVWLYTQIPVRVPEHRRAAAVELLTRANHGLAVGNFEFDYTDGEVRFKAVADTADGCFSVAAAGRLLRHSMDACDRYHDALMQVIYGGLSPVEAVR